LLLPKILVWRQIVENPSCRKLFVKLVLKKIIQIAGARSLSRVTSQKDISLSPRCPRATKAGKGTAAPWRRHPRKPFRYATSHSGQLSLAIPPWV